MFFVEFSEKDTNEFYELLGEAPGYCLQADGTSALNYLTKFHELRPHNASNNADQAKERCRKLCGRYSWCYAAEVYLFDYSPTPDCNLVTDRPTFENEYGKGQDYEWSKTKAIDGRLYQTLCAYPKCQDDDNIASNWGGGKVQPRKDTYCYKKIDQERGM